MKSSGITNRTFFSLRPISAALLLFANCCIAGFDSFAEAPKIATQERLLHLADMPISSLISMEVRVTGAARKAQSVADTAAAVFVISQEDIRRSGVTTIAEALRMAPGLNVARVGGNNWSVNARGSSGKYANKLLVLMDGRTLYTPVLSNVFWSTQDYPLDDIDRIEVIRGPGASLWGSNAVNGVINIVTKKAQDTKGTLIIGGGGTEEQGFATVRHGKQIGDSSALRVYGKTYRRDNFVLNSGGPASDTSEAAQTGFRLDSSPNAMDTFTLQGDIYYGEFGIDLDLPAVAPPFQQREAFLRYSSGGNVIGRWTRKVSEKSEIQTQLYYDRVDRDDGLLDQSLNTIDLDFQHLYRLNSSNEFVWGGGYRFYHDDLTPYPPVTFDPSSRNMDLFTGFVQDEITLLPDLLKLIVGAKFEVTEFTGLENQPTARFIVTPREDLSFWGAVSRAVRTPARSERDASLLLNVLPPSQTQPFPVGVVAESSPFYDSENLLAYELGYRQQFSSEFGLDLTLFYNSYSDVQSFEAGMARPPGAVGYPFPSLPATIDNRAYGYAVGSELAATWQIQSNWRVIGTYSYLDTRYDLEPGSLDIGTVKTVETESPDNQASIRSLYSPIENVELDAILRYVDSVPAYGVDSYIDLDLRVAWKPWEGRDVEFSVVGQNLLQEDRLEIVSPRLVPYAPTNVQRGVYGKITIRY